MLWRTRRTINQNLSKVSETLQNDVFEYDDAHQTATAELHYESPADIMDTVISKKDRTVFSGDTMSYLLETNSSAPNRYAVNYEFHFDDLGDSSAENLLQSMKNSIRNRFYLTNRQHKSKMLYAILFILLGLIFAILTFSTTEWSILAANDSAVNDVVNRVFDELVALFISEAGAILFLSYALDPFDRIGLFRKFGSISIHDADGKTCAVMDKKTFYSQWRGVSALEGFATTVIPVVTLLNVVLIAIELIGYLCGIFSIDDSMLPLFILSWAIAIFYSTCNILFYVENPFGKKLALPFSVLNLALYLGFQIYVIVTKQGGDDTGRILYFYVIASLCIVINIACLAYLKYKEKCGIGTHKCK